MELALIMGKQVKNLEAENEKEAYDSIESVYSRLSDPILFLIIE